MQFAALALTLLLAVGSHARSMQSDAPMDLAQYQEQAMVYLNQVRETAQKTLDSLDSGDYAEYKMKLSQSLDGLTEYAQTLKPYGDAASAQFLEATKNMRERAMQDIEELHQQLAPQREQLREVLAKHTAEYRDKLEPIIQDYITKGQEQVVSLKAAMTPLLEDMQTRLQANVEETKAQVLPMVEVVRTRMTERLEQVRTLSSPYVEEYKDQLQTAVLEGVEKVRPHAEDLQTRMQPYWESVKEQIMAMYKTVSDTVSQ